MDYRIALGVVATIIGILGFAPYIKDTIRGKTKPHAFSWLLWGILESIGFAAQITTGAGPGSWVTGFSAAVCFFIFFLALKKGSRDFSLIDWVALVFALCAIPLWYFTKNPLSAVLLIVFIDAVAFVPTYRKAFNKPHEETLSEYALCGFKYIIGIAALSSLSLTTWLYPASIILTNWSFVIVVCVRRQQLEKTSRTH